MSYCVNCGVELDKTRSSCPLCQTVVYNPNQPVDLTSPTPYPKNVGRSEHVDSRELLSLLSIVLATAAVVCGLLNLLIFTRTRWSVYVIGVFVLLWVYLLPVVMRDKINPFLAIMLDGVTMALYVGTVAWMHPGQGWFQEVAFPIILVSTILIELFYLFNIRLKLPGIVKTMVVFAILAIISVSIQVLTGFHFNRQIVLTWSAIVLACCVAIDVILFALLHHKGARKEFQKRMHF